MGGHWINRTWQVHNKFVGCLESIGFDERRD